MDLKLLIKDKRAVYTIVALVLILVVLGCVGFIYKGSLIMPPNNTKQFSIGGTVSDVTANDGSITYTLETALPYSKFGRASLTDTEKLFYIDNKSVVQVLMKDEKGEWSTAYPTIIRDSSGKVTKISGALAVNIIREGDIVSISTKENVFLASNFHADKVIIYR